MTEFVDGIADAIVSFKRMLNVLILLTVHAMLLYFRSKPIYLTKLNQYFMLWKKLIQIVDSVENEVNGVLGHLCAHIG